MQVFDQRVDIFQANVQPQYRIQCPICRAVAILGIGDSDQAFIATPGRAQTKHLQRINEPLDVRGVGLTRAPGWVSRPEAWKCSARTCVYLVKTMACHDYRT